MCGFTVCQRMECDQISDPIKRPKTRLLGRPQPQMYPQVALDQYTWSTELINILYVSRHHKYFKIDFTPKLSSQQHSIWGGGVLGKRMLNPTVLKCHEDLITLETYVQGKTMDSKFFIGTYNDHI